MRRSEHELEPYRWETQWRRMAPGPRQALTEQIKLRYFDVEQPSSVAEAVRQHAQGHDCRYLAGGTALMSSRLGRKGEPEKLINLKGLPDLTGIERRADEILRIGALTGLNSAAGAGELAEAAPALADACGAVGSYQVRNLGTVGGNICNAVPAGDLGAALIAHRASVVFSDGRHERRIDAANVWRYPGETAVASSAVMVSVEVPSRGPVFGAYEKFGLRQVLELGVANAAVSLWPAPDGSVASATVAVSGVHPYPLAVPEVDLAGTAVSEVGVRSPELAEAALAVVEPEDDFRASAAFRRRILPAVIRGALEKAQRRGQL